MGSIDKDAGGEGETARSWGNIGKGGSGVSVGAHIASAATSSLVAIIAGGIFLRFVDRSADTSSAIAAAQIANAASNARVETEVAELKIAVDRLSERPAVLVRDLDDVRTTEARDIQRLEGRLDQLEQRNTGRR